MPTYYQPYMHTYIRGGRTYECGARRSSSLRLKSPTWTRAGELQRLSEVYSVIEGAGGLTFTLRLNRDGLICVTGSADPARDMSRRIQRAFKRRELAMPLLAFSLEVTPDDREELHLHGAIAPGELPRATLVAILSEAGGKIDGKAAARQVKLQAFDEGKGGPAGWARYPRKGAARTLRVLDHHKITYISQDLKRLGRER